MRLVAFGSPSPFRTRRWPGVHRQSRLHDFTVASTDSLTGLLFDAPPRFLPAGVFAIPELRGFQAQLDHVPGPGLIHFLVKIGQLPQQVGGAQAGSKLDESVTGAQKVMNQSPSKAFEPTGPDSAYGVRQHFLMFPIPEFAPARPVPAPPTS